MAIFAPAVSAGVETPRYVRAPRTPNRAINQTTCPAAATTEKSAILFSDVTAAQGRTRALCPPPAAAGVFPPRDSTRRCALARDPNARLGAGVYGSSLLQVM